MDEKLKKYLHKIVDLLVKDTSIRYDDNYGTVLFNPPYLNRFKSINAVKLQTPPTPFIIYCQNTYGVENKYMEPIWRRYRNIIIYKIDTYDGEFLNESVDKQKRFLDKVLEFLIKDTYRISKLLLRVPFSDTPVGISYSSYENFDILSLLTLDHPPVMFNIYVQNTYGLNYMEVNYVWDHYKSFLMEYLNKLQ